MKSNHRMVGVLVALGALGTAVALPQATSARLHRADLVVTSGSVQAADGMLTGSIVVKNKGSARATDSAAAVVASASGKNRVLGQFGVAPLRRSRSRTVNVSVELPRGLPVGDVTIAACADSLNEVKERSEANNCREVGSVTVDAPQPAPAPAPAAPAHATPAPAPAQAAQTPPQPTPPPAETPKPSTAPTSKISFEKDQVFTLDSSESRYWVYVPNSYDERTPTQLFVWLHGCSGESAGDIYTVSPGGDQRYIAITVGGKEGGCWDRTADQPKVLAAIADAKSHFNIDPRQVVIGGYSSGGELAYETAFRHAEAFAGVLAENTSPFGGGNEPELFAAASWRFHVVHLAHTEDEDYSILQVREETNEMKAGGFPITRIERPGTHWDDDAGDTGTDHDLRTVLLPHLNDGWRAP